MKLRDVFFSILGGIFVVCLVIYAGRTEDEPTVVHDGFVETTTETMTEVVPSSLPVTETGTVILDLEEKMSFSAKSPSAVAKKRSTTTAKKKVVVSTSKKSDKKNTATNATATVKSGKKNVKILTATVSTKATPKNVAKKSTATIFNIKGQIVENVTDPGVYFIKKIYPDGFVEYDRFVKN